MSMVTPKELVMTGVRLGNDGCLILHCAMGRRSQLLSACVDLNTKTRSYFDVVCLHITRLDHFTRNTCVDTWMCRLFSCAFVVFISNVILVLLNELIASDNFILLRSQTLITNSTQNKIN